MLKTFALTFATFTITPLAVFLYMYYQYRGDQIVNVPKEQLEAIIFVLAVAALALFWGVRRIFQKVTDLSLTMRQALYKQIDRDMILKMTQEDGEVAELARGFNDILTALESNVTELEETKRTLHAVVEKVGRILASSEDFDLVMYMILETALNSVGAVKGAIVADTEDGLLVQAAIELEGVYKKDLANFTAPYITVLKDSKKTQVFGCSAQPGASGPFAPPLVAAPFIFREKFWGALIVCGKRKGGDFNDDEIKLLSNLGLQMAVVFENAALNRDMEKSYLTAIATLVRAEEARDTYSRGHSERVSVYAIKMAREMDMADADVKVLEEAARLHDIGKIGISDSILRKPGLFTEQERQIMRTHPVIGESIVKPLKKFRNLLDLIRHHHEFLDGTGYPDGLKGKEIPVSTRILTMADIFDALTSDRTYRQALSIEEARAELRDMTAKGKLDAKVMEALERLIDKKTL